MALALTIATVAKTSLLMQGTLKIRRTLDGPGSLSCRLSDPAGTYCPSVGQSLTVTDGATTHFAGLITAVSKSTPPGRTDVWRMDVQAQDYSVLADRYLVAEDYESETAADIVADLRATYLAADGVTDGTIEGSGITVSKAVFNYQRLSKALDEIANLAGCVWYIDDALALQFHSRSTNAAPFSLGDATDNWYDLSVTTSTRGYRNRQYLRAGMDLTDSRTESFKGDSARITFNVGFPVAKAPTITVGGAGQTVGILGVDTGKQWYWNKNQTAIVQDAGGTPITSSQTLAVTYQGFFPILQVSDNDPEIASRATVEGFSGIYESIEDDPNLHTSEAAEQKALALLTRFGEIPETVEFGTRTTGLIPGQLITVNVTEYAVNDEYLVESVTARDEFAGSAIRLIYQVRAISGDQVQGWRDFFRSLGSQRTVAIRENEMIVLARYPGARPDGVNCTDELTAATASPPEDRVGYALVGFSEVTS